MVFFISYSHSCIAIANAIEVNLSISPSVDRHIVYSIVLVIDYMYKWAQLGFIIVAYLMA